MRLTLRHWLKLLKSDKRAIFTAASQAQRAADWLNERGMTGRYLIYTPVQSAPDEERFDAAWRRFAEVCRSLHRDRLDYSVTLNLGDAKPHVLVTASGKAKPRRQVGAHRVPLPPPIPAQRCRDRAIEVEWFLPENLGRRKDGRAYWAKHQTRYQELSGMPEDLPRAELEYWLELELLSGQRERFKPDLTDETAYSDDEVAA